jgi:hypothetical protein
MSNTRIQMGTPYGHTPANTFSDFEWIRENQDKLLALYGECSLIVYNKVVLGTGRTYEEALLDAEQHLPPDAGVITPVHQWLRKKRAIYRIRKVREIEDA